MTNKLDTQIHVLADETLGGIKREFIEVERKAEVGDSVIIVDAKNACNMYGNGDILTVEVVRNFGILNGAVKAPPAEFNPNGFIAEEEFRVLEPTDIVHIDGQRFRLVDRKAEVGERVIIVSEGDGWYEGGSGEVFEVIDGKTRGFSGTETYVETSSNSRHSLSFISPEDYCVLEPVESESSPESLDDIIANLVRRVSELEKHRDMQAKENRFMHDNIEGAKRDIVTWSQEIESMKYANEEIYSRLGHVEADVDERFMKGLSDIPKDSSLDEGTEADAVHHPQHYKTGRFETIEVIEDITAGYDDGFVAHCVGTSVKYLSRAPFKHGSPLEDLEKSRRYLDFAIERLKEGGAADV